jgi:hypothetical protein
MMYKAKVVCSEIRTKHSTQSEHHVDILMLNMEERKESATLKEVKVRLNKTEFDSVMSLSSDTRCRTRCGH